jgi:hypothetical protein
MPSAYISLLLSSHHRRNGTSPMTPGEYLERILNREAVDTGPYSPVRGVQTVLNPIIREWASTCLLTIHPSGSFMKGTANKTGTDIDLFISLAEHTSQTLKEIYDKLFARMAERGYAPTRQNVSINVRVNGYSVDLVPGKRQNAYCDDYSLYRRKADTWTKTNVVPHINHVIRASRLSESRIIKLWRDQRELDFPSFYLELTVIDALSQPPYGTLANNVWRVLQYFRDRFPNARVLDPANTNNVISDDLSAAEKTTIKAAAEQTLKASKWEEIVT